MIIGIVAIAKNLAIGRNGKLPWHFTEDLRHFKQTTSGNAVVMGSATWRSIGKPLPGRLNIILSRSLRIPEISGAMVFARPEDVIDFARKYEKDVYVIGGARTYTALSDAIEKWIVTEIPLEIDDADTFMPGNFLDDFEIEAEREIGSGLHVKYLRRK